MTHNSPGSLRPSIAALTYSFDPNAARYAAITNVQPPRTEEIGELKEMAAKAIQAFCVRNGTTPHQIVFYRDGLSEGEMPSVAQREMTALDAAVTQIITHAPRNFIATTTVNGQTVPRMPKIVFVVVGKRHNMLFFGKDSAYVSFIALRVLDIYRLFTQV